LGNGRDPAEKCDHASLGDGADGRSRELVAAF